MIRIHWTVLLLSAGLLIAGTAALLASAWHGAMLPCGASRAAAEAVVHQGVIGAALVAAGLSALGVGGLLSHLHASAPRAAPPGSCSRGRGRP